MKQINAIEHKIVAVQDLSSTVDAMKLNGRRIVFTNGCFDILHVGHVTYLSAAKDLGDVLIVGLNTDNSVKQLNKGTDRPINNEMSRAFLLASLAMVDYVVLFNDSNPLKLIETLIPNVLVKGGDYDPNETDASSKKYIVGSDIVRKNGGDVCIIDLVEGYSTTSILQKIKA
jgi:rfaE bifunctional protein nucleotidyltransferase chain/domain